MARPLLPRIALLRFHVQRRGPFPGPEYGGALFRGGCALLDPSPHWIVFETPVIPEESAVLRKHPRALHRFVVVRSLDAAVTQRASFPLSARHRMSARQGHRVQTDRVFGSAAAEGDLTGLAPYIRMGEWVNNGPRTAWGYEGTLLPPISGGRNLDRERREWI